MQQYLNNILPRLKRYTIQLNQIEYFIEKSWIKYDIENYVEFTFERDKSLIISINGNTQTGSWNLLSTGKLHIIKPDGDELLSPEFLSEDIFILSKKNIAYSVQLFVNEKYISGQKIEEYVESAITNYQKKADPLPYITINGNEEFKINNYPDLLDELKRLKISLEKYSLVNFKEIITSYAISHTLKANWNNENPALCKGLVEGKIEIRYLEHLFNASKENLKFKSQLLAFVNEILGDDSI